MWRIMIPAALLLFAMLAPGAAVAQVLPEQHPPAQLGPTVPEARATKTFRTALFGAAAGALIGFGIGHAEGHPRCPQSPCMPVAHDPGPSRTYAIVGAISGGTVGWLLGVVAGRR
jgi:membrane protein YqaA with SNARE-associated domain